MCHGLIWRFCVDEEVFFFCMEGSFFWLPQDDMTVDNNRPNNNNNNNNNNTNIGKARTLSASELNLRRRMSTFAVSGNCYSLECCFIADDEICSHEMLVVPQRYRNLGLCSLAVDLRIVRDDIDDISGIGPTI